MPTSEPTSSLLLNGLDGSNPLGFLAAIGTLRTATKANRSANWRMRWEHEGGTLVTPPAQGLGTYKGSLD